MNLEERQRDEYGRDSRICKSWHRYWFGRVVQKRNPIFLNVVRSTFFCRVTTSLFHVPMTADSTLRQRTNGSVQPSKFVVTKEGQEADKRLDSHETYVLYLHIPLSSRSENHFNLQLWIRWSMGSDCHHDWLPDPHVLPLDLSMVLRRKARLPIVSRRHPTILVENVGACCKGW